jgi:hypothetical protein
MSGCVRDAACEGNHGEKQIELSPTGEGERFAGDEAGQLAAGDQGAGERDPTDEQVQEGGERGADRQLTYSD